MPEVSTKRKLQRKPAKNGLGRNPRYLKKSRRIHRVRMSTIKSTYRRHPKLQISLKNLELLRSRGTMLMKAKMPSLILQLALFMRLTSDDRGKVSKLLDRQTFRYTWSFGEGARGNHPLGQTLLATRQSGRAWCLLLLNMQLTLPIFAGTNLLPALSYDSPFC